MDARTEKLMELEPVMRPVIAGTIETVEALLDTNFPGRFRAIIFEAAREPARQWALYRRGRRYDKAKRKWVVVDRSRIFTNATPDSSAHCVQTPDGKPASMAADIVILLRTKSTWRGETRYSGAWLWDQHPAWSFVPAAAASCGYEEIDIGAAFKSIRGGDWPHIQRANWRRHREALS